MEMKIKVNSTQNENKLNPEGPSCVLPAPSEKTCQGGCVGNVTHAVEAICARDIIVGSVICHYPHNKMFINRYPNEKERKRHPNKHLIA